MVDWCVLACTGGWRQNSVTNGRASCAHCLGDEINVAKRFAKLIEQYPELPHDDYIAFMQLESEFRRELDERIENHSSNFEYCAADYMNKTLAAAKALDIDALNIYEVDTTNSKVFSDDFVVFQRDVDNIIVQMRVQYSRRSRKLSVGLTQVQKTKIHTLISKIRQEVDESTASVNKKEKLFGIIAKLSEEVDKPRTGFERFGDLARGLSGISKDVATEGAEPWWKWFKAAMGIVDEAKEAEPQLPKPKEIKRIEPPRKRLPKPTGSDPNDEIPF